MTKICIRLYFQQGFYIGVLQEKLRITTVFVTKIVHRQKRPNGLNGLTAAWDIHM